MTLYSLANLHASSYKLLLYSAQQNSMDMDLEIIFIDREEGNNLKLPTETINNSCVEGLSM